MYNDINQAFISSLKDLIQYGNEICVRSSTSYEILDYSFIISNPSHRVLTRPHRYNNFPATIAETLWVLAGRSDMQFLSFFLPNATSYSDDGTSWRGAYGTRLRRFYSGYDQINGVIEAIKKDPYTRQAIMVIPRADYDYDPRIETKDRPCTIFVQFMVRDNKLHCFVRMRSNDVMWGCFNINVVEFTFLQELIAGITSYKLGNYHHNANSFHYYEVHKERINNILLEQEYDIYRLDDRITEGNIVKFNSIEELDQSIRYGMDIIVNAINLGWNSEYISEDALPKYKTYEVKDQIFTNYILSPLSFIMLKKLGPLEAIKLLTFNHKINIKRDMMIANLEYIISHANEYTQSDDEINETRKRVRKYLSDHFYSPETVNFVFWRNK